MHARRERICKVASGASAQVARSDQAGHRGKHRQRLEVDLGRDPRRGAHLRQVSDQAEPGHVGRCPCTGCPGRPGRIGVQPGHRSDGRGQGPGRDRAGGVARRYHSGSERLREHEGVPRESAGVGERRSVAETGHREAELGRRVVDRVASDHRHRCLPEHLGCTVEHLGRNSRIERAGPAQDLQGAHRFGAHGVHVAQRVRSRDAAPVARVVDDGCEHVDRLHHRATGPEVEDSCVVGQFGTDQHPRVTPRGLGRGSEDRAELRRRELASAAGAGGMFGEAHRGGPGSAPVSWFPVRGFSVHVSCPRT